MPVETIIIAGDICPLNRNLTLFQSGDTKKLFGDLLPDFESASLVVANLECPLIQQPRPIRKTGPVLGAETSCIAGLSPIDVLGLANNHILDHGPQGLESTLRTCRSAGIETFGAGPNLSAARQIHVRRVGAIRIGFLGMAEHEWSIASHEKAGANPLDLIDYVRNVQQQRNTFDFLVVLLHGGTEHYPFPSPELMNMARFLVEQGAQAVICQHSHCAGCHESYRGGHILYGQGNMLFDSPGKAAPWQEGFLVRLSIHPDLSSDFEAIPFIQSREAAGARRMAPDREEHFLKALSNRSQALADEEMVREQWLNYCRKHKKFCLEAAFGHGPLFSKLNRKGLLLKMLHSERDFLELASNLRCEAYRELILTVLEQHLGQ
jgi:Bacterial capsule synthesis protein PGA_cap